MTSPVLTGLHPQEGELSDRPRILAFAYACEPDKGSEPGAGWTWVRMLATFADVTVLTRRNNQHCIERALPTIPEGRFLHFAYVDLPRWARFWKKKQRGVRTYYLLWQLVALWTARTLRRNERFDLYWHLTFANGWFGTLAPLAGRPFIYGPIGGGTAAPWRLLRSFGLRGALYEFARSAARLSARYLSPVARIGWAQSDLILAQNPETLAWLPRGVRNRTVVFPNTTLESQAIRVPGTHTGRRAIYAGRLLPLKGISLALRALVSADDWTLVVCGDGSDRGRLSSLAAKLGVADRVRFLGWQPRSEVLRLMAEEADVFLFPSLHDEAPFAVVDALGCGLPVICFSIGASPVLGADAAVVVDPKDSVGDVVARLSAALRDVSPDCSAAIERAHELTVEARAASLVEVLSRRGLLIQPVHRSSAP